MDYPRIAVLVDLERDASAGGHVKYWERIAQAAARNPVPVDLTIYFSGNGSEEVLSPHVRIRYLPPVFSTSRLKWILPYVPAHTDLASYHPRLAQDLLTFDVIHTTDGYFAFSKTARHLARERGIPLVNSFHTDTPSYTELFTRQTLESLMGQKLGAWLDTTFGIAAHQKALKIESLKDHLRACSVIMAMRREDRDLALSVAPLEKIRDVRFGGIDTATFHPQPTARAKIERDYGIPADRFLVLFVGRVDAGKAMPRLLDACAQAIATGANLHLFVAGLGPMADTVKETLKDRATIGGWVPPQKLATVYAASDAYAMVSDVEIGGRTGLEALACGCPVLVSKASRVACLYPQPNPLVELEPTVEAWMDALTELAQNAAKRQALREAVEAFRRQGLKDWDAVLKEDYIPAWQSVLKSR